MMHQQYQQPMMMMPAQSMMVAPPQLPQIDSKSEEKLDRWVEAKRARDFDLADRLREELRRDGVEPDKARPPLGAEQAYHHSTQQPMMMHQQYQQPMMIMQQQVAASTTSVSATDEKLDRWVEAKRARDFNLADRLREELRRDGVEPDKARPPL